jgi:hypothetical protein
MTDYAMNAKPGSFEWTVYPPTIIIHGREQSSGDTVTRVSAPGTESVARISPSGDVSLVIQGAQGVGRSGEARIAKSVASWLANEGVSRTLLPGNDPRGEDRRLRTGERTLTIQIVTVPSDTKMWEEARKSSTSTVVGIDGAADWIAAAIQKKAEKTSVADRRNTILVLDAQHANSLTELAVIERFVAGSGDPKTTYGFAGVWIVGSSSAHCARIGTSEV